MLPRLLSTVIFLRECRFSHTYKNYDYLICCLQILTLILRAVFTATSRFPVRKPFLSDWRFWPIRVSSRWWRSFWIGWGRTLISSSCALRYIWKFCIFLEKTVQSFFCWCCCFAILLYTCWSFFSNRVLRACGTDSQCCLIYFLRAARY